MTELIPKSGGTHKIYVKAPSDREYWTGVVKNADEVGILFTATARTKDVFVPWSNITHIEAS
jgi:hypothetical protein